ncbi:hypothetical protein PIB30_087387 [Stylosanthes scabra]|uniref:Uncharacterized protein n=1 Tax=Stylosanthes scabra TaxID=79078 RepID=A0ABU6WRT0_9FABA|nr:hypothetical protein [Stylosanthes scabra]
MGNAPRQPNFDPYSQTFNPGWRNHPNFRWGGQGNQGQTPYNNFQQQQTPPMEPHLSERPPNTFPSNTVPNTREECKAIRVIELEEIPEVQVEAPKEKPEVVAEIKNIHHLPQSSKKHTRPFSKLLKVFSCLRVNISLC